MLYISELEIGVVGRGELNFDQSFQQFNVKKKNYMRRILGLTLNAEY